ncbi:MAG TPA: flagellar hook capping FlgD N-terminal domain-containing protein [Novosphingobium sp.]
MSAFDVANTSATQQTTAQAKTGQPRTGFAALGQGDFLRLLTAQMSVQDPFDPVDNKEMLAQMAQFSQLAGVNDVNTSVSDVNATLKGISDKLDAVLAAQAASQTPTA